MQTVRKVSTTARHVRIGIRAGSAAELGPPLAVPPLYGRAAVAKELEWLLGCSPYHTG